MKEEWRDIKGYEGWYQVSNLGNVMSLPRKVRFGKHDHFQYTKQRILKPKRGGNTDYWYIGLSKNNEVKYHSIHRLVAQAFIDNPENKAEVNHKDGDKKNNLISNLEWTTRSENLKHRYRVLGQTNRRKAS